MDDWLLQLDSPGYEWQERNSPASGSEIAALLSFVGRPLPADYVAFLRMSDGATLSYKDDWLLQIWPAWQVPEVCAGYGFTPQRIPGGISIAADGGSEALVYDTRPQHPDGQYPIYLVNYVTINWREAIFCAPDFHSMLLLRHSLFWNSRREAL